MVREIQAIENRVGLNPISVPSTNASAQLINTLQNFSGVVGGMAESAATERAAIEGMLARESGREVNLAPGITRPTAAFNQAYRDTDARMLARSAEDLIASTLSKTLDPRNLNSSSAASFDAKAEGIIQGTLSQSLPENRGRIEEQLKRVASIGKSRVQNAVIDFENKNLENQFKIGYQQLREDRTAALLNKDNERVAQLDNEMAKFFQDWGTLSENINQQIPGLVQKLSQEETKARYLGDFLEAQAQGVGNEYLNTFVQTKTATLNPQDKMDLISEMVRLNNATKAAQAGSQALSMQRIENDIDNWQSENPIRTEEELEAHPEYYNLTPLQQQQLNHKLLTRKTNSLGQQQKFSAAIENIANGRAAFVEKGTVNDLFMAQLESIEANTGRRADLATQFGIVQQLQTNVPKFDALLSSMLTSQDATAAAQAGNIYAAAGLNKQQNLINLSGDAATVAEKIKSQLNYTANPSEDSIKSVLKQVLERTDPQVEERTRAATQAFSKNGAKFYKEVMGVEPDPFTDQGAYAVFKNAFQDAMVRGNTPDEAARIAKDSMKDWGTDKWFVDNIVGMAPPTKMLPMSEGNYNIRNQLLVRFDALAKVNNQMMPSSQGGMPMKFVNPVNIPTGEMSQNDFVYKALDQRSPQATALATTKFGPIGSTVVPNNIAVEVDGVRSDLKLISSPVTTASPEAGLVYGMFAKDKFGIYQQLKDPLSPDGLAYIVLNDVNVTAPAVTQEGANKQLLDSMTNARRQQREVELQQTYRNQIEESTALDTTPLMKWYVKAVSPRVKAKAIVTKERFTNEPLSIEDIQKTVEKGRADQAKRDLEKIISLPGDKDKGNK